MAEMDDRACVRCGSKDPAASQHSDVRLVSFHPYTPVVTRDADLDAASVPLGRLSGPIRENDNGVEADFTLTDLGARRLRQAEMGEPIDPPAKLPIAKDIDPDAEYTARSIRQEALSAAALLYMGLGAMEHTVLEVAKRFEAYLKGGE